MAASLVAARGGTTSMVISATAASIFKSGPLAGNSVASRFEPVPKGLAAPDTVVLGGDGKHSFRELHGKARLVSLWAEWCSACLVEMPDLLRLQQRYGGPKFEMLAILTGSFGKLDLAGARAALAKVGADKMPLWIEQSGESRLLNALARRDGRPSLPCNLLLDAKGRIRGRSFGAMSAPIKLDIELGAADMRNGRLTQSGKAKVARAQAAAAGMPQRSAWSTPDGDAFIKALASGALG